MDGEKSVLKEEIMGRVGSYRYIGKKGTQRGGNERSGSLVEEGDRSENGRNERGRGADLSVIE